MSAHWRGAQRLLIAAGGSGGHLFPAQKVARGLKKRGIAICFAGAGLANSPFFDRAAFDHCDIDSPPLSLSPKKLIDQAQRLYRGVGKAGEFLKANRFDAILGFGSFHTVAILAAATWRRIPLFLHEANARPGKTAALFAPFAKGIAVQFQALLRGRWQRKAALTRMPLMSCERATQSFKKLCFAHFGLRDQRPTLLIFGGSQGAAFFNDHLPKALQLLSHRQMQVLHLAGQRADCQLIEKSYRDGGIDACVRAFERDMQRAWAIADLVICRAGSSTLAEIQHFCIPALLIPYPGAGGHQIDNAEQMVQHTGGALLMRQSEGNGVKLRAHLENLLQPDRALLDHLRAALCAVDQLPKPQELDDWMADRLQDLKR